MPAQYDIHTQHVLTTAATKLPVDVSDVRAVLGVDHSQHDVKIIEPLIKAAVAYIENYTQRQLMDATWTLYADHFPDVIELRKPPVSSVTSVSYIDTAGNSQTLTAVTDYRVDTSSYPARITPAYGTTWPSTYDVTNAVTIVFQAGASSVSDVPWQATQAIHALVSHWYDNPHAVAVGTINSPMAFSVNALLDQICWTFA